MYLPPKKCVEFKFIKSIEHGKETICLGNAILSQDHLETKIFFRTCPNVGTVLIGDLNQRADITLESMAECRYEFKESKACKKSNK